MSKRNWFILFILITFIYSLVVIKDFQHPLAGSGDEGVWTYYGYYFAKNLHFDSFIQKLSLTNNQIAYPYGINQVLQDWSIERELWYAAFYRITGRHGAYLQYYYVFSLLISVFGVYYFLRHQYSINKSAIAAILITFCNFYAINKYAGHYAHVILHWTTLSIVTDYLLVGWVINRQKIPLHFLFLKAFLLLMVLGQNLSYVAGYALSVFCLSVSLSLPFPLLRRGRDSITNNDKANNKTNFLSNIIESLPLHRGGKGRATVATVGLLLVLFLFFSYLYLPILFQIVTEAKSVDSSSIPMFQWWDNPVRLLLPYLPKFNPLEINFQTFLHDAPEGLGAASPGLFMVILGAIGFIQNRKKPWVFIPMLVFMLMCMAFHTTKSPTLKIFPWFEYSRVSSRSTLIYPIILVLISLQIDWSKIKKYWIYAIVFLGIIEIFTVYQWHYRNFHPTILDDSFNQYMSQIKQAKGEAVLDFPFCAMGDNAIGKEQCMFYQYTSGLHTLQQYHEKKVTTFFLGRVHPKQIKSFEDANWKCLFLADNDDIDKVKRQKRCFTEAEMQFFEDFFKYNDFCGISLYTDLLAEGCEQNFYKRFGKPTAETYIKGTGRAVFIPKPDSLRQFLSPELGKKIKFSCN
jgi:hypothetical protein